MNFVLIETVDDENYWIDPAKIYAVVENPDQNLEIYISDDVLETNKFKSLDHLMKHLGIEKKEVTND
jgi:uncharacterized membrane protein YebE (DUF533 family)